MKCSEVAFAKNLLQVKEYVKIMANTKITESELDQIAIDVSNWGRWGSDDERGALNLINDVKRAQAASLVQEGLTISCALPMPVTPAPDNPDPVAHYMLATGDLPPGAIFPGMAFTADYFAVACHGFATTHLDALCHIIFEGKIYNGYDAHEVTSLGANRNSVMSGEDGIVGRGVLLDIPGLRGVEWLEPGDQVTRDDLEGAEDRQGIHVEDGDIVMVATGRDARREANQNSSVMEEGLAGLGADSLPWLHERGVAVLGCDGVNDVLPGNIGKWTMPIHQMGMVYIGLHLIDNMQLNHLLEACRQRERWTCFFTMAPLKLERGTGCPVNPIAVL